MHRQPIRQAHQFGREMCGGELIADLPHLLRFDDDAFDDASPVVQVVHDLLVGRWVGRRLRVEDQEDSRHRDPPVVQREDALDHRLQAPQGIGGRVEPQLAEHAPLDLRRATQRGQKQVVARLEVVVEHPGRPAGLLRDSPDRGGLDAVIRGDSQRRIREFRPSLVMVDNLRHRSSSACSD